MRSSIVFLLIVGVLATTSNAEDLKKIIKKAIPATVAIEWTSDAKASAKNPSPAGAEWRQWPNATSYTSGTIVSPDGLIVTPGPSVGTDGSSKIVVALSGGDKHEAAPVVVDRRSNLTLLKVDLEGLPHLEVESGEAEVGEGITCVAAYDLEGRAVTRGIVAAKDRSISDKLPKLLQTDVHVGLMSSGGPILNDDGKIVGIVVARSEGKNEGVTFAIPAMHVKAILSEATGTSGKLVVAKPFLGVELRDGPAEKHAMIARVVPDSPADRADVQPLDLILSIEGKRVDSARDAQHEIAKKKATESVTLRILREGKVRDVTAKLAKREKTEPRMSSEGTDLEVVSPAQVFFFDKSKSLKTLTKPKDARDFAYRWYADSKSLHPLRAPTVRVERSGIDKRVEELGKEMKSLSEQISKLTDAVNKLQSGIEEFASN